MGVKQDNQIVNRIKSIVKQENSDTTSKSIKKILILKDVNPLKSKQIGGWTF